MLLPPSGERTDLVVSDKLLTLGEVQSVTSLSRATIYRQIEGGDFPSPIKIGRTSRWPASEVEDFIEACKERRAFVSGEEAV